MSCQAQRPALATATRGSRHGPQAIQPGTPAREIEQRDSLELGIRLLDRIVAGLRGLPWRSLAPVTDDFVVYHTDYELVSVGDALREAAGKKQFARWDRAGLVP